MIYLLNMVMFHRLTSSAWWCSIDLWGQWTTRKKSWNEPSTLLSCACHGFLKAWLTFFPWLGVGTCWNTIKMMTWRNIIVAWISKLLNSQDCKISRHLNSWISSFLMQQHISLFDRRVDLCRTQEAREWLERQKATDSCAGCAAPVVPVATAEVQRCQGKSGEPKVLGIW